MAYEPTVWNSGDVVTSAKLNNIETGISNATPLIIAFNEDTGACDHTWQEIYDALVAGRMVVSPYNENNYTDMFIIVSAAFLNSLYNIYTIGGLTANTPVASVASADGYPVMAG